jgi:hypothetical protein
VGGAATHEGLRPPTPRDRKLPRCARSLFDRPLALGSGVAE